MLTKKIYGCTILKPIHPHKSYKMKRKNLVSIYNKLERVIQIQVLSHLEYQTKRLLAKTLDSIYIFKPLACLLAIEYFQLIQLLYNLL